MFVLRGARLKRCRELLDTARRTLFATSADPKLSRMVASICYQPWYQVVHAGGANARCACVHLGHFDHRVVATTSDGQVGVVLDGWLFGWQSDNGQPQREPQADAAQFCLREYLTHGTDFVRRVNGHFNLTIWDDRSGEVFLVNDRYGLRPWQYACLGGTLYFAPEGKTILAGSGVSGELNFRTVINQLSWGRIWIGQETFFKDILMLPPAAVLHWKDGKATIDQYWDYVYEPEPNIDDEFIDHTVKIFRRAVARQTRGLLTLWNEPKWRTRFEGGACRPGSGEQWEAPCLQLGDIRKSRRTRDCAADSQPVGSALGMSPACPR